MPQGEVAYAYRPIAEYIAGKFGLRIYQYGTKFRTTGNVIQIPNPPQGLEQKFIDAILGGILHEGWHIRNSDFAILEKSKTDKKYSLLNMLEDLRDENNLTKDYAGGGSIMKRFNDFIKLRIKRRKVELISMETAGIPIPPKLRLKPMLFLSIAMSDKIQGYDWDPEVYDKRFVWIRDQCQDIVDELSLLPNGIEHTETVMNLSVKLYQRLASILPKGQKGEGNPEDSFNIPKSALPEEEQDEEDMEPEEPGKYSDSESETSDEDYEPMKTGKKKKSKEKNNGEDDEKDGDGDDKSEEEEGEEEESKEENSADEEGNSKGKLGDDDGGDEEDSNGDEGLDDRDEEEKANGKNGDSEEEDDGSKEKSEDEDSGREDGDDKTKDSDNKDESEAEPEEGGGHFEDSEFWEQIREDMFDEKEQPDKHELLNDFLDEDIRGAIIADGRHVPHPMILKRDVYLQPNPSKTTLNFGDAYNRLKEKVAPQIGILQGRLLPLLVSENKGGFLVDQEDGDIDESRLYLIRSGYERIYRKKVPRKNLNTCIVFLGDTSGSMAGSPLDQMQRCFVVCSETCETVRVPYELLTFTTSGSRDYTTYEAASKDGTLDVYNRYEPIKHVVIKSFEERLVDIKWRIVSIRPESYNCDPEALWWAGNRIAKRREKRKIVFMLHDGYPNLQQGKHELLNNELRIAIETLESSGVEVYGIGIMTDVPRKFYKPNRCLVIMNDGQIAESIYKLLDRKLREG